MAFTLDRVDAAQRLWVSTRTIDRHIQAGKIRTRRIGKKMFLEEDDVDILRSQDPARSEETYEVLDTPKNQARWLDDAEVVFPLPDDGDQVHPRQVVAKAQNFIPEFLRLYNDALSNVHQKDEKIQDLSYRLWQTEAELKNAIPLTEYKKATFLLESAKQKSDDDTKLFVHRIESLEKEINKRNSTILGLAMLFVLVLAFSVVFFFAQKLALV